MKGHGSVETHQEGPQRQVHRAVPRPREEGGGRGRAAGGAGPGLSRGGPSGDAVGVVCLASLTFANPWARSDRGPRLPPPRGECRVAIGWPIGWPIAIGFFRPGGWAPRIGGKGAATILYPRLVRGGRRRRVPGGLLWPAWTRRRWSFWPRRSWSP